MVKAIIIKGNPKYINNPTAKKYYKDIEVFLKAHGVGIVEYDDGLDGTLPKLDADLYIGHSRGCGRRKYMPEHKQKVFLMFGVPEGIIDPIDLKWCNEVYIKGTDQQPPNEHFILIQAQKDAILNLLKQFKTSKSSLINAIPQEILELAEKEKFLAGSILSNPDIERVAIAYGRKIVGFYTPSSIKYKGKIYWKVGTVYILPQYRNKGLGSGAILDFFSDKLYGIDFVETDNKPSLAMFKKAGFKKDIVIVDHKTGTKLWRLLKEPTVATEGYEVIPQEILEMADKDPYIEGYVGLFTDAKRVAIKYNGKIVGFYTPKTTSMKGKIYWRTGAIYVLPQYRKRGLAGKAVQDFFAKKKYGLAYIDPTNEASLATFMKNGFYKDQLVLGNISKKPIWRMLKDPEHALKPAFLSW